ncbi:YjfB family protein [Alkaliphilus crotonatoxidans]
MNIEALSTIQSMAQVKQAAAVSVLKMTMDQAQSQGLELIKALESTNKALEQSVHPHLGGSIDIYL